MGNASEDIKAQWLDALHNGGSRWSQLNDDITPKLCVLGFLTTYALDQPQPKPTFRQRMRNRIQNIRENIASKIVGYDIHDVREY